MDAINNSPLGIKQNIHLIKNVVMPIDLIPVRIVAMAFVTECVGLLLLLVLLLVTDRLSPMVVMLPLMLAIQMLMLLGMALFLSVLGVIVPDLGQVVGLVMLLLMFISPIAFQPDMVPSHLRVVLLLNPFSHMLSAFRGVLLGSEGVPWQEIGVFLGVSLGFASAGGWVFGRLKGVIVDYE